MAFPTLPQNGADWHPEDVRAAIRKRFGTLLALSRQIGRNRDAVGRAIRDRHASSRVEQEIAEALGVRPHQIWPSRWDARGNRLTPSRSPLTTAAHAPTEPQKRSAA